MTCISKCHARALLISIFGDDDVVIDHFDDDNDNDNDGDDDYHRLKKLTLIGV